MARFVALLFLLAVLAVVCAEGASRSLQGPAEPAHFGFNSWWISSGKKHSRWNHGSGCYDPVTSDRSWTYYRMAVRLRIDYSDTWSPNDPTQKVSLFMGVSYGKAIDLVSGQEVGVWQAFTVSTADEEPSPDKLIVGTISNLVIELGPNGDDSITIAGATSTAAPDPAINDDDNAVTGGIGKYLGAAGSFTYKNGATTPTPAAIDGELKIWVPRLKEF